MHASPYPVVLATIAVTVTETISPAGTSSPSRGKSSAPIRGQSVGARVPGFPHRQVAGYEESEHGVP